MIFEDCMFNSSFNKYDRIINDHNFGQGYNFSRVRSNSGSIQNLYSD